MKIAILGTRGVPNNYGGFEQFADLISTGLAARGHDVTVYNPHYYTAAGNNYRGVKIVHQPSHEKYLKTSGVMLFDYFCMRDALKKNFDIIYMAGYGTSTPAFVMLNGKGRKRNVIVTNMDGMEWRRDKLNGIAKAITKWFESICVRKTDFMIADNIGISEYFKKTYNKPAHFIPYGAAVPDSIDDSLIKKISVQSNKYFLILARMEPENNLELSLQSYLESGVEEPILIIGSVSKKYGKFLLKKYNHPRIKFLGSIYDKALLDSLRKNCLAYIHGHSVGGTNPSLLEAMASEAFIFSHENEFNHSVINENAFYFGSENDLKQLLLQAGELRNANAEKFISANLERIKSFYNWERILDENENFFQKILDEKKLR